MTHCVGVRQGTVDVTDGLRVATGIIEGDVIVFDFQGEPYHGALVQLDTVVINSPLRIIFTVRNSGYICTYPAFGGIQYFCRGSGQGSGAVPVKQCRQPPLAQVDCADLALDVPLHQVPGTYVEQDKIQYVLAQHAFIGKTQAGDAQGVLPGIPGLGVIADHAAAAHVGMVTLGQHPVMQLPVVEYRFHDVQVRRVVVAAVRVVQYKQVALVDIPGKTFCDGAGGKRGGRGDVGDINGLRHQFRIVIEDGGGEIPRFRKYRRA